MSPFSLSDDELNQIMSLAAAVPLRHRKSFLRSVCEALAQYPEGARGVGLIHREAVRLQKFWATNTTVRSARSTDSRPWHACAKAREPHRCGHNRAHRHAP